jgi:hypothetical protein
VSGDLSDWERLLSAERCAVPRDLRDRFDEVLSTLESVAGWETSRVRPVLILGRLDGVLTGIRQLRRTAPLETALVEGLRVATYRQLVAPWNDWKHLASRGRAWAKALAPVVLGGVP